MALLAPRSAEAQADRGDDEAVEADIQTSPPVRIRVRSDTIIRWQPRYVFTVDETQIGADQGFWQRVNELPLYQRLTLDGRNLADGAVDVHLSAWGALDLTFDADGDDRSGAIAAGDFAQAYVRARTGPVSVWGGRRFVSWGLPGGLHVDGGGVGVRHESGFHAEAMVGRPVTPRFRSLLGSSTSFQGVTAAYGARAGFTAPGRGQVAAAYVERWAEGLPVDRVLSVDGTWRPLSRLDLGASVAVDVDDVGVSQATAQASWLANRELTVDVLYTHRDPRRLIPAYSLLSVFASSIYDEAAVGVAYRLSRSVAVRAEGGLRHYDAPGSTQGAGDPEWGYRAEATLRALPVDGRAQYRMMYSRRDDGDIAYNLADAGVSFKVWRQLTLALQATFAIQDDGDRDSVLGRATLEYPVVPGWDVAGTVGVSRTAIAEAETRGLLRVSYRPVREGSR